MTSYLLDTDIAIELLRGHNDRVVRQLASKDRNAIFLSTVTVAELLFGALRSWQTERNVAACQQFCSAFQVVPLDQEAGERSATGQSRLGG